MPLVTIDGPGGVGKTSVSQALAARLGFRMLPSGRIYRAMAWVLATQGWREQEPPDMRLLEDLHLHMDADGGMFQDGTSLNDHLASEAVSRSASRLSIHGEVRDRANRILRDSVRAIEAESRFPGVILEGRDMGTVVFPEAQHKFFLTADPEARAERRYLELAADSPGLRREDVLSGLQERDQRDSTRDIAPLKPAEDATIVDTTQLSLEQVVDTMLRTIQDTASKDNTS